MKRLIVKTLRAILNALDKTAHEQRKPIYTDKNGNTYYTCDIARHHGSRRVALQAILDQMSRGIDNERLYKLLNTASEHIMANRKQDAVYAIANIKARTADITNHSLLYRAALLCIYLDKEPDDYSKQWADKKDRLWQADEDARFFFMHWSLTNLQGLQELSSEALQRLIKAYELEEQTT